VVIQTRDGEALMDANIPALLDCGRFRNNIALQTDVRRTGTQYAVGFRLNATGTGIERHSHRDTNGERANTHERQLRRAASDTVAVMSRLAPLRPIFKKTGADLEGLCGKARARQITMGSVAAIHSECLASFGGFASAPSTHRVWRNFEVASWGESHSDACNARHAPPGQSSTTYIISNNSNSNNNSCSSSRANEPAVPSSSNSSSSSDAVSAGDATAAAAQSGSGALSASDCAAAAAESDDSSGNGASSESAAAAASSNNDANVSDNDNGTSDASKSAAAAAASSNNDANVSDNDNGTSDASKSAAAAANSDNAAAAAASSESSESAAAAAPGRDTGSSSNGVGGGGSSSNGCATSNCVKTPRACLEAGGQFFIGTCRVKLGHGITIMYRYVQTILYKHHMHYL
jgi:hypothetical protein